MRVHVRRASSLSITLPVPYWTTDTHDPTTAARVRWIDTSMRVFTLYSGQLLETEPTDVAADFVTDFMHWCDAHGIDFDEVYTMGLVHHAHEVTTT